MFIESVTSTVLFRLKITSYSNSIRVYAAALFSTLSIKPALIFFFLICAVPVGGMMAVLTPPGQVPDEPNHLARAAGLLNGAILIIHGNHISPSTGKLRFSPAVKIDRGLVEASLGHTTIVAGVHQVFASDLWIMTHTPPDHAKTAVSIPNTATYFPTAYIPAALGLAAGLAAHATPMVCFTLARLAMLATFLILGVAVLRVAAYGEAFLLSVLLLPMTLFLAGSANEDGVLIAMACLAAAALSNDPLQFPLRRALGIVMLVLLLAAKPPYLAMLGLCLLPCGGLALRTRFIQTTLAALPVLLWLLLVLHFTAVPFGKPPYHPGPLWSGDPGVTFTSTNAAANLHILMQKPARLLTLPWHTYAAPWQFQLQLHEMIGALGLMQIRFALPYYVLWGLALVLAFLGGMAGKRWHGWKSVATSVAVPLLLFVAYWMVTLSMYLNWTNVGAAIVEGLQGRYLIPLLPFLLLAAPAVRRATWLPAIIPALPAIALGIFDIGYLPLKFVTFYYLH